MSNQTVRMTIEFEIIEEVLKEYGVTEQEVMDSIVFGEDEEIDGFYITTNVPGYHPVDISFLKYGSLISIEMLQERSADGCHRSTAMDAVDAHNLLPCVDAPSKLKSSLSDQLQAASARTRGSLCFPPENAKESHFEK